MEAKASTFSFLLSTLCSQVLHTALCLVCVCTQSFMQYLCKAISAPSELLCTVQCVHCFQNKIQLNKICLNYIYFFLFCHLTSRGFQPNSSLPSYLFHSEEYKVLSPGLSTDISVFILHSALVPERKRNTGTARTVNSLHHTERRTQLGVNQTHHVVIGCRETELFPHRGRNEVPGKQWDWGGWTAWEEEMCN